MSGAASRREGQGMRGDMKGDKEQKNSEWWTLTMFGIN